MGIDGKGIDGQVEEGGTVSLHRRLSSPLAACGFWIHISGWP